MALQASPRAVGTEQAHARDMERRMMGVIAARQVGAKTFSEGFASGQEVGEDLGRKSGRYFLVGGLLISIVGTVTGALPGTRRRSERSDSAQQAIAADHGDNRRDS